MIGNPYGLHEYLKAAEAAVKKGNREEALEHIAQALSFLPQAPMAARYGGSSKPIDGWMTAHELDWLFQLGRRRTRIVEVGSWCGRSTHAILSGNLSREGRVWAVDHFQGSPEERDGNHKRARTENIRDIFLANVGEFPNLTLLEYPSDDAARLFDEESVDAVFLDAGHDEESVEIDVDAWAPKVKFGGLLCGHDVDMAGVAAVIDRLLGYHPKAAAGSIWALQREGSGWLDYTLIEEYKP